MREFAKFLIEDRFEFCGPYDGEVDIEFLIKESGKNLSNSEVALLSLDAETNNQIAKARHESRNAGGHKSFMKRLKELADEQLSIRTMILPTRLNPAFLSKIEGVTAKICHASASTNHYSMSNALILKSSGEEVMRQLNATSRIQ